MSDCTATSIWVSDMQQQMDVKCLIYAPACTLSSVSTGYGALCYPVLCGRAWDAEILVSAGNQTPVFQHLGNNNTSLSEFTYLQHMSHRKIFEPNSPGRIPVDSSLHTPTFQTFSLVHSVTLTLKIPAKRLKWRDDLLYFTCFPNNYSTVCSNLWVAGSVVKHTKNKMNPFCDCRDVNSSIELQPSWEANSSSALQEKLDVYETRNFISVFAVARYFFISSATRIHLTPFFRVSLYMF